MDVSLIRDKEPFCQYFHPRKLIGHRDGTAERANNNETAMRVSYLVLSLESSTLYVVSSSTTVVLVVVLVPR